MLKGGAVILLDGDLGAGKTRFAQGVAKGLGVTGLVTSPTFNLVLEYPLIDSADSIDLTDSADPVDPADPADPVDSADSADSAGSKDDLNTPRSIVGAHGEARVLRHFDLYRLEQAEQLDDLDYFGSLEEQDAISLVEWGSKFATALPLEYLLVRIQVLEDLPDKRRFELSAQGTQASELLEQFARAEGMEKGKVES